MPNQIAEILQSVNQLGRLDRRHFLAYASALSAIPLVARSAQGVARPSFQSNPFTLGVASGDPDSTSVVLWTRLAPKPLVPSGGMGNDSVEVQWEVASDDMMKKIVASGRQAASAQFSHSVHVEAQGLAPDRWYWYRFRAGDAESPIGRTRTLPAPESMPEKLKFAFASCQHFEQGLFTAYEQMAKDELDLVFHLGDYIYEYEAGRGGSVRTHLGDEIQSLDDYRIRLAQYREDPLLQNMHAQCPWFVTWDDHEFDNNNAGSISEEPGVTPASFLQRRANSYQAYYEMMPLRSNCVPKGPDMQLYRKASFGKLAEFLILDTRQYRSDQPNNDKKSPLNSAAKDPSQSMLGEKQRKWMLDGLDKSSANWNVLAQQVMMGLVIPSGNAAMPEYSMDQWPGYAYERMKIMQHLKDRKIKNPVVLTGDIHSNWVNELRVDDTRADAPLVATEFVTTSLSSGGNGKQFPANLDKIYATNPCVKFHNAERGYVRCSITKQEWKSDYMVVDEVTVPGGTTFERSTFVVESGNPKVLA
jgi:alkaline phosphatase D